ncbi:MAG: hypothetical protein K1X64_01860 [Myxococcaceae bacterium]|nr:hypothetical protein [Myxococcaceae bacterium]
MSSLTAFAPEVRRCAKCGEEAVLLSMEWRHTVWGTPTNQTTRDFRCHACGAQFTLVPRSHAIIFMVMGVIMGCAIFPLGFSLWGWLALRRDKMNPVVPGAPPPRLRYRDGPPLRLCTCGQNAVTTKITRERINGLPAGTEYIYQCGSCQQQFTVVSFWRHCAMAFSALVLLAIAAAFFTWATSPGWRYGGSVLSVIAFGGLLFTNALYAWNRSKYATIDLPLY